MHYTTTHTLTKVVIHLLNNTNLVLIRDVTITTWWTFEEAYVKQYAVADDEDVRNKITL